MMHLRNSGLNALEAQDNMKKFLCDVRMLFWLEILGITVAVERSIPILQTVRIFRGMCPRALGLTRVEHLTGP